MREEKNPQLLKLPLKGLSTSVQRFENSHPKLVGIVNSICNTLSNIGIWKRRHGLPDLRIRNQFKANYFLSVQWQLMKLLKGGYGFDILLFLLGIISSISCLFCPTPPRGSDDPDFLWSSDRQRFHKLNTASSWRDHLDRKTPHESSSRYIDRNSH
jgi:hypothetical protein